MPDIAEELFKFNPWWENTYSPDFVSRPKYINFLEEHWDKPDIMIVTGIRRVGKTTLMRMIISRLLERYDRHLILYASLDSIALGTFSINEILREYRKIHGLSLSDKVFLFFDEVGFRPQIHQLLKNLYDTENVKIVASASSASIMRDTQGFLTGRARLLEVLPLDFDEFLAFRELEPRRSEGHLLEKYFEEYMQTGGIPEFVLTGDISYLDNLIDNVIHKDIVAFHGIRDLTGVTDFFRLLMERAGKQISLNKMSKILGISPDTIRRYLDHFIQTFLVYTMERCGKLNERIRAPKKLFAADIGIRNRVTGYRDKGAIFENLVYLKIKHKSPCYVYRNGIEIDFQLNDILMEVKLGGELSLPQRELWENYKAKKRILVQDIDDYLNLTDLLFP